jgi:predicted 2-oxoglutarate/Fe(II)-dependent dioxygenase YbiX
MKSIEFFAKRGFFVEPDFVSEEMRDRISREMLLAHRGKAEIFRKEIVQVDEDVRRTSCVSISQETNDRLHEQYEALTPRLAKHFGRPVDRCTGRQLLVYQTGDFFKAHSDQFENDREMRQVSTIVTFNADQPSGDVDSYQGGELTFYGLLDDPTFQGAGFSIELRPGLLIGFDASIKHSVNPVTQGRRLSSVAWYGGLPAPSSTA